MVTTPMRAAAGEGLLMPADVGGYRRPQAPSAGARGPGVDSGALTAASAALTTVRRAPPLACRAAVGRAGPAGFQGLGAGVRRARCYETARTAASATARRSPIGVAEDIIKLLKT